MKSCHLKCHLKFSSKMTIFYQASEITELKYTSLIKMIILEENFKWHLEAFASELFIYSFKNIKLLNGSLVCFIGKCLILKK